MVDTVDGKGVAMRASETAGERGKKKMALLGSVSSIDPYRRTPEEVLEELFADPQTHREKSELARPKPLHKRVRACLARDACDTTAPHTAAVFEWIARENAQRNPDRLKPTVVLIDGQGSLWRAAWEFVPGEEVTEILDIVHVAGYVWEAANLVCGSDPDRARAWAKTQLGAILDGRIGEVIGRLHLHERYLRGKALERLERVRT